MNEKMRSKLLGEKAALWRQLEEFAARRDAHGVHDMAVEITAIEILLKHHDNA